MKRTQILAIMVTMCLVIGTDASAQKRKRNNVPQTVESSEVISNFRQYVEEIPYYSEAVMQSLNDEVTAHIEKLHNWKNRESYIEENDLQGFLARERQELQSKKDSKLQLVNDFLKRYDGKVIPDSLGCRDSLQSILGDKLGLLETNLNLLEREMNDKNGASGAGLPWMLIGGIAGGLVLLVIIWAIINSNKKKKTPEPVITPSNVNKGGSNGGNEAGIVVRRKTATILKKQSLEDVIDNSHYMKVDLEDCCYESAVRRMYIKDACIADIYNMYENDQENPADAKEYGCMVLGRWVYDAENSEYYVSLEQVVLPGEDAVFEEYELNFGGKIKLKVLEQLRKLRRETNLQYDLTCWIHSHPGLTVFFSNADSNVQDQLKHPQHPKFLTALVVDTLTPTMETGVFTYHRDMTLNSKNELKKLYSLKEWYAWAQESIKSTTEKASAVSSNMPVNDSSYFNLLEEAKEHTTACYGINLSKDMVVDLCMALSGQSNGIVGLIQGRQNKKNQLTVCTAERLSDRESEEGLQQVGCFVVMSHFSVPSVRKAVAAKMEKLKFVLVYTPTDGMLTSVPMMAGDLCGDESYYGSQKLEDLKLWTKKGR